MILCEPKHLPLSKTVCDWCVLFLLLGVGNLVVPNEFQPRYLWNPELNSNATANISNLFTNTINTANRIIRWWIELSMGPQGWTAVPPHHAQTGMYVRVNKIYKPYAELDTEPIKIPATY